MRYRGNIPGMGSWILHRATGVGILIFLLIHIVDTVLIGWGPDVYNTVMAIYKIPLFRVGEVLLAGTVLFHALNGLRIIVFDFWEGLMEYQERMVYAEVVIFFLIWLPVAWHMLKPVLFGGS